MLNGIDNLTTWIPTIHVLYQSFEQSGYNKEAIIELLKTNGIAKPVQEDMTAETYYKAAQELHDMDVGRNSWTNEDPSWESTAGSLDFDDLLHGPTGILDHGLLSEATSVAATSRSISRRPEVNIDLNTDTDVDSEIILPPPPVRGSSLIRFHPILIVFSTNSHTRKISEWLFQPDPVCQLCGNHFTSFCTVSWIILRQMFTFSMIPHICCRLLASVLTLKQH